jgi:hypothetical protein
MLNCPVALLLEIVRLTMLRRQPLAPALVMLVMILLAACGTQGRVASGTQTPPTTTQPPIYVTPNTSTPTATPREPQPCDGSAMAAGSTRIGDLILAPPAVFYGFGDDYALPDGLPDKPLSVTLQNNEAVVLGTNVMSMPVAGAQGFLVMLCNVSKTQSHQLKSFGATLVSLTPYVGQLNTVNACAYLYARTSGFGGECASGFQEDLDASLTFPATATAGASATWAPASPEVIPPGQGRSVAYFMKPPAGAIKVTYRLGIAIDSLAMATPFPVTQPEIIAPIARKWDGSGCKSAAMQAQIPASIPAGTYYICPPA